MIFVMSRNSRESSLTISPDVRLNSQTMKWRNYSGRREMTLSIVVVSGTLTIVDSRERENERLKAAYNVTVVDCIRHLDNRARHNCDADTRRSLGSEFDAGRLIEVQPARTRISVVLAN